MAPSSDIRQFEGGITSSERLFLDEALFKGGLMMTSTSMCMSGGKLWMTISILPDRHLAHNLVNLSSHNCLLLFVICKLVLIFDHVSVTLGIFIMQEDCTRAFRLAPETCSSRISSFCRSEQIVWLLTLREFWDWLCLIVSLCLYCLGQPGWIISCYTCLSWWRKT